MQHFSSSSEEETGSSETISSDGDLFSKTFPSRPKGPPIQQADATYPYHLSLLRPSSGQLQSQQQDVANTPIFTLPALGSGSRYVLENPNLLPFPQYGLLSGMSDVLKEKFIEGSDPHHSQDPRVFFNITVPSSTFICGSQGSGKSHTLSCLLENCLIPSSANKLPKPLAGLVFHYDTFISDDGGSPCEAAYLASHPNIKVRVLCSPTNIRTIERTYQNLNVTVEPLQIKQSDLNTKRMLDMMAVNSHDGPVPLYVHTIYRVLREMRMEQQETGTKFNYNEFKNNIQNSDMIATQLGPLKQRLDTLESFMPRPEATTPAFQYASVRGRKMIPQEMQIPLDAGNDWTSKPGCLTIVDLSCPCITPEGACALFNICLSLFLEQDPHTGRVIALDEAHKFMNTSADAETLTNTLLSTIRLQRHLGARVIISTQEPTISPKLLDLCSVTIVHRFSSPEWLKSLRGHLAGASPEAMEIDPEPETVDADVAIVSKTGKTKFLFAEVINLKVGQALLFCPSAIVGWEKEGGECDQGGVKKLGGGFLNIQVRSRITYDGGKSIMAS